MGILGQSLRSEIALQTGGGMKRRWLNSRTSKLTGAHKLPQEIIRESPGHCMSKLYTAVHTYLWYIHSRSRQSTCRALHSMAVDTVVHA